MLTVRKSTINNNTTGATCGAGAAYRSGAPEFTPRFLAGFVLLNS